MANDNKTVSEIVKQVRRECNSLPLPNAAGEKLKLVREINDAHKREIAAKDEEILNLRKSLARVMEVTGDCRKCEECGDETCPWFGEPDGCNNREGRELFLAGKLVDPLKMKDAEIARLRECLRGDAK